MKQDFLDWLEEAKFLLPPKMKVSEARLLYQRKAKEESELDSTLSQHCEKSEVIK